MSTSAIVYFSLTGHSEDIANRLAHEINGDLMRLADPRYKPGVLGYLRAGWHSLRQNCVLAPQSFDSLQAYDRLILCGPVWTSYPATPLRALLRGDIPLPSQVALFLTSGDKKPAQKAWELAARDLGRPLVATASLGNPVQGTPAAEQVIARFLTDLATDERHVATS